MWEAYCVTVFSCKITTNRPTWVHMLFDMGAHHPNVRAYPESCGCIHRIMWVHTLDGTTTTIAAARSWETAANVCAAAATMAEGGGM